MKYLLNSAVTPEGCYGTYEFSPATVEDLRAFVCGPYEFRPISRIGYAETAKLIGEWTGWWPSISREALKMKPGDEAMVVRLKYRVGDPSQKGKPTGAREEDWEIARLRCR